MATENCKHWWGYRHDWDKWKIEATFDIYYRRDGDMKGEIIVQKKMCKRCGFIKFNSQEITI